MALTAQGLEIKDLNQIREEMRASLVAKLGVSINTDDDSVIANIYDPAAEQLSDVWQALQSIHNATDPDSASDESLDRVVARAGVVRLEATRSTVAAQHFLGDNNTTISADSIIEVDGTLERFRTLSSIVISTTSCVRADADVTTVNNNTNYTATVEGTAFLITSDATATKEEIATALVGAINADIFINSSATDNLDGTFYVTPDDGVTEIEVSFGPGISTTAVTTPGFVRADNFGPVQAPAGTLNSIVTPTVGWTSTVNPLDAALGRNEETDPELRLRFSQSLAIIGESTVPAIRAQLAQIIGVDAAIVIENDLEVVDGDGRPPHSFESIVLGGDDDDIAEVVYNNKPAGIQTHGSETVVYIDEEGITRYIKFSRPTEIYLHVRVSYTKYTEEAFPTTTGEASMAQTVLTTGNALTIGNDVLPERFKGPIFNAVSGIAELTIEVATSAGPLDPPGVYQTTPLSIDSVEVSVFDSTRITIIEV